MPVTSTRMMSQKICTRQLSRVVGVVRCTATVDPPASALQPVTSQPTFLPAPASQPKFRPATSGGGYGAPERAARPARTVAPRERLPEYYYLEDDEGRQSRDATNAFTTHVSQGRGLVIRSLGRQGAFGAIKFLLNLRAAGEASPVQRDLRFRMLPQDQYAGFGNPLMLFVETLEGRQALPSDGGDDLRSAISVSSGIKLPRLQASVAITLDALEVGQFLRMDMVGAAPVHQGLQALAEVFRSQGPKCKGVIIIPALSQQPLRVREGETVPDGEPPMIDVVHLYVTRLPGRAEAAAAARQQAEGEQAAQPAAASPPEAAGNGPVTVSLQEWESLRGALSQMIDQQRMLAQLLEQQQAAAAAAAPSPSSADPPVTGTCA